MCLFGMGLDRASLPLATDLLVDNSTNDRLMNFFQELSGQSTKMSTDVEFIT